MTEPSRRRCMKTVRRLLDPDLYDPAMVRRLKEWRNGRPKEAVFLRCSEMTHREGHELLTKRSVYPSDRIVGGNGLMDATKIYGRGSLIIQGVSELPGNFLCLEVNENPSDPLGAGASKDILDVFWMDDMITWLPKKGLVRAKLRGRAFWKSKTFILKSMNISGEGRFMAGLKSTSNG
ncbi:hypothetical protein DY000_02055723 [Brassica cretica]|uniref:Uncharacterized protein n=1 Tax=Brassica cretica TaxID=69181 RepID=A0ABQ7AKL3_BRACR|nr:hypothetical protein DY000_02055723 [Brassica cretica]